MVPGGVPVDPSPAPEPDADFDMTTEAPAAPRPQAPLSSDSGAASELQPALRRPWPPVRPALPRPVSQAPRPLAKPTFVPRPNAAKNMGRRYITQGESSVKVGAGRMFSLTKAGTYTSMKSDSGDFLMQQRVEPAPDGRFFNTAIGFRLGTNVLKFDTAGGTRAATLTLNGEAFELAKTTLRKELPGGGSLKYDPGSNKIYLQTAEGDRITVRRTTNPNQAHLLNVTVDVAESRQAGTMSGMLGHTTDDDLARHDAVMRDGSTFGKAEGLQRLTPEKFIDEWRSTPDENVL